jgi:hypothetical protein
LAASILRAETFGIPIPDWAKNPTKLAEAVDKVIVPDFQPKQGVKIETDEKATSLSSASVDDAAVIEELIAKLEAISKTLPPGFHMNPIQFEKVSTQYVQLITSQTLILRVLHACTVASVRCLISFSCFLVGIHVSRVNTIMHPEVEC